MADALVLALSILGVACLPAVVAAIVCADELIDRLVCSVDEWRDRRRERRVIGRLDRTVSGAQVTGGVDPTAFDRIEQPAIERIAADLRRLGHQRLTVASRSATWQRAVHEAYDGQLRLASHALGITEHLSGLQGVDLEIERVRVEGELHAAGMSVPTVVEPRGRS
ncbi:hypothetical protein [Plantactinospora sp. GCM10030261]|uniref:hypothetical protein n=1 Tax=Plantactinospora sp. GCM10030261 TaxID=3273420 RepID=UPI0036139D13